MKITAFITSCISLSAWSQESSPQFTPHIIGIQTSVGAIDTKENENTQKLNDITSFHYNISYQYQFNDYFSAGIGYLNGDSEAFTSIVDVFTDSELEYTAFMLSARAQYPFTKRNSIYLQLNSLQYDYDIIDDNKTEFSHDGSDFGFDIGWKHQYDMGLGLKLGYEILNLGSFIKIKSINAELSYRF